MTPKLSTSLHCLGAFICFALLSSCVSQKDFVTFEEGQREVTDNQVNVQFEFDKILDKQPYKIRIYDQLLINVNGFEGDTQLFLNQNSSSRGNNDVNYDPATLYHTSFIVDEKGAIELPLIGIVKVQGFTTSEVRDKINSAFKDHFKVPFTSVKVGNQRITVIGEVENPGSYFLYHDRNTILDALGLAGGLTDFSNRKRIRIIRKSSAGQETAYINLANSEFVYSDYYYLQPDDIIFVKPVKARALKASAESISVVLSSLSLGVLILNLFTKKN